ncbi:MAG TPA: MogA/MoaB family molybdenum cofactor biosynthesis protein [Fimbriimonadaceae bacterium]|nr:MogA/MoaB family molybdenum cofactor biosynthesis protein [Fimbriimonadaceae bacterium]
MATRIGILTVSDSRSAGQEEDLSGPAMQAALAELGYQEFEVDLVPDEVPAIQKAILELCETCAAVFTTGGTGFTPRDVTPEATAPLLEKRADSLMELVRLRGLEFTKLSHISRGVAGVRGSVLIVNLPGSPKAVRQGIEALAPLLPELLSALAGERCSHGV